MLLFILSTLLILMCIHWLTGKPQNYPPGPLSLPIIGSALSVKTYNFHLYLESIKKYYGPVIGFKFGSNYVVGVTGSKEVKEVLSREEFQGRPIFPNIKPGIMFSEGQFWSVQRKFTIRHLREFGFGKKSVEIVLLEEIEEFFQKVIGDNKIIQVSGLFNISVVNILWTMISGKRHSYCDAEFKYLLKCLERRFRSGNVTTGGLSNLYPLLKKIFPFIKTFKDEIEIETLLNEFLQKTLNEHKKTKTEEANDFLDVYLTELEKNSLHESYSEETLKNICSDLFSAGSESVSNSLGFCLLYCILYPDWQEELFNEINTNQSSLPLLENPHKFPKVEAFLAEVMRCNTIASIAVPHKALKDTTLNGYFIPKNCMMLVNIWSVLQDKEYWKDPENFRPERHLDENGNYKKNTEWLPFFGLENIVVLTLLMLPELLLLVDTNFSGCFANHCSYWHHQRCKLSSSFCNSSGKRICPGESLSKSIIFVYLIILIRTYKFRIPEGHPKPSTVCLSGFTNAPQPFEVQIALRN